MNRKTMILFDSNSHTNPKVRKAREALTDELAGKGAQVLLADVPAQTGVNGPDDLVAACGDEALLEALEAAYPSQAEAFKEAERAVGSLKKASTLAEREAAYLLVSRVVDYGRREYLIGIAADALDETRRVIRRVVEDRREACKMQSADPPGGDSPKTYGPYLVESGRIWMRKNTREGPLLVPLCNFNARVREELVMDDGVETTRSFVLEGQLESGQMLPTVRVPVARFSGMSWVPELWGLRPVVCAGLSIRDQLREAIQRLSPEAPQRRIFTHTGWRQVNGRWIYLTANGAVGCDGIEVELGPGLERYRLPKEADDPASAMKLSLKHLHLAPLTVPLWAGIFRAPLATPFPLDLSLWPEGRTGSLKSTLLALMLCHFGDFQRTTLPGTWLSTANQLEHRSFTLKDMVFAIDDYAPGTLDARELEIKASRLLRAQGNLQGRGRLRADLSERAGHPPRGLIISTGEQHPPGQSTLARNLVIRMKREDVDLVALGKAQKNAGRLKHAMSGYITWLAPEMGSLPALLAETFEGTRERATVAEEHLRVPEALAHLWLGLNCGLIYAEDIGACSHVEAEDRRTQYWGALLALGRAQGLLVESERPSRRYLQVLHTLLIQRRALVLPRDEPAGVAPSATPLIGWRDADSIYLLPEAAFQAVARFCRECGEGLGESQPRLRLTPPTHIESLPSPNGNSPDRSAPPAVGNELHEEPWSDQSWRATTMAQRQITELGWEIGILEWLEKLNRRLYHVICTRVPNEIDALWEAKAPLEQFTAVLRQWVEAHRIAVSQWRKRPNL